MSILKCLGTRINHLESALVGPLKWSPMSITTNEHKLVLLGVECGGVRRLAPCWEVRIGTSVRTCSCIWPSCELLFGVWLGLATKSPGTVSGWPYTSSAVEQPRSSLGAVRIPRSTHGNSLIQLGLDRRDHKADSKCRWKRSMRPLDCGGIGCRMVEFGAQQLCNGGPKPGY